MPRPSAQVLVAVVVALAMAAPVSAVEPSGSPVAAPAPIPSGTPTQQVKSVPLPVVRITVLDPGTEPRQLLRYDWTEAQTETTMLEIRAAQSVMVDGTVASEYATPIMRIAVTAVVTHAYPDGTFEIETSVTGADLLEPLPGDAASMDLRAQLETLVGWWVRERVDDRRTRLRPEVTVLAVAEPHPVLGVIQADLRDVATLLPNEPVGPGAI